MLTYWKQKLFSCRSKRLFSNLAQQVDNPIENLDQDWSAPAEKIFMIATDTLSYQKKRHSDWFDGNYEEFTHLVDKNNSAHNRYLLHPTRPNKQSWTLLGAELQRESSRLKNEWWIAQAQEIQRCGDEGRVQGFYDAIKRVDGHRTSIICPLKSADGVLLKDK